MTLRRPALLLAVLPVLIAAAAHADVGPVSAQSGTADWRTYANGDEVFALAIDPTDDQILWSGTEGGGVVAWDLASGDFSQYLFPNQPGLMSNDVRDVAVSESGDPWLATAAGVTRAVGNEWAHFDTRDGLPSDDITAVAVGLDGDVWAGTYDDGVAVLESGASAWTVFEVDEFIQGDDDSLRDGPGASRVADIAVSDDGRVWVAHGRQNVDKPALSVFYPEDDAWRHVSAVVPGGDTTVGPATDQILAIAFDDEERMWLGTWSESVLVNDLSDGSWTQYDDFDGVCGLNVWDVATDAGQVWVTCEDALAAAHWDGDVWTPWSTFEDGQETGLPTEVARGVAVVGDTAYLGTNGPGDVGSGIVPIEDGVVGQALTTAPLTPPYNDLTALAFEPDTGVLWVGTRDSGLMRFDGARWERFTVESTDGGMPGDTVTDLLVVDDELWVAATKVVLFAREYEDGGVSALNLGTDMWREPISSRNSALPDDEVSSLAVDEDGRLWIGIGQATGGPGVSETIHSGNGVAVYDPVGERFDEFFVYNGEGVELAGNTVLDLARNGDEMWVATSYATSYADVDQRREGGGISLYGGGAWTSWSGDDDGFRTYHGSGDPNDTDPFITGDVRSTMVTRDDQTWAGTWVLETGLLEYTWPYVDAVVNRSSGGGWLDDVFTGDGWVPAMVEDTDGFVWAGTTRGHDEQEADLLTKRRGDTARGGAHVWSGSDWRTLAPDNAGIAANAITSMAVDPTTGYVWVGTENNGLSVYESGDPQPTPTECVDCPTPTSRPTSGPTRPPIITVPVEPTQGPGPGTEAPVQPTTAPPVPTDDPDEPKPPPEVPEPGTLLLLGAGLAGLAGYARWRRNR